ncbi:Transcription factor [Penicillium cataractarum]|uniref:Transcription factor n=1 Tax=Penicillium cataractarum TaxID=2100454 RepID=A0A9W9UT23_9EURO|nr:Transcription factor [Penicillium cataractarum]KAJ5355539.1 Transcription factor [Penicillium cataractarum]
MGPYDVLDGAGKDANSFHLGDYPFLMSDRLSSLEPEDLTFLSSKGSLSIPSRAYTKEFVTQYFLRIHPILPVLDEIQFWHAFEGNSTEKVSLFVFQALLFASCPFVSLEILQRCGFTDKRDARKKLYNRSKLLYELMVETRPSVRAQGAILLTHHTSAEAPQAGSLWLTRAIENAMLIDTKPLITVENISISAKKRLWWSILLRDRSLCIGLRRQPQIASHNLHGCRDWLREEDFEQEMHCSPVYDFDAKKRLFKALQDQCRLAVLLTDLVSLVFTPRVTAMASYSKEAFRSLMCTVEDIKTSLVSWEAQSQAPDIADGMAGNHDPALTTKNLTFMYYHAARVDLAQFAALAIEEHLALTTDLYREAVFGIGKDLSSGIRGLTAVMEYFSHNGHVENLPLSVLGYVGMPLILAAIDLKLSPSGDEMKIRQRRLDSLSRIIRLSESLYDVTDFVAAGTNHILQLAYMTTQNFFLPSGPPSRMISDRVEQTRIEKQVGPDVPNSTRSRDQNPIRAKCWLDAFLRCPRAYLLISTSVDYSLAVGRLPYDTSLPALVRDIPAMGAITQLPWTIDTSLGRGTSLHAKRRGLSPPSECDGSVESTKTTSVANTQAQDKKSIRKDMDVQHFPNPITAVREWEQSPTNVNQNPQLRFEAILPTPEQSYEPLSSTVNLDFLDLDMNLDNEIVTCYDSPIGVYDNFCSLPTTLGSEKNIYPGKADRTGIDSDLNTGLTAEGLDSILYDPLFHDSSAGAAYFNV